MEPNIPTKGHWRVASPSCMAVPIVYLGCVIVKGQRVAEHNDRWVFLCPPCESYWERDTSLEAYNIWVEHNSSNHEFFIAEMRAELLKLRPKDKPWKDLMSICHAPVVVVFWNKHGRVVS